MLTAYLIPIGGHGAFVALDGREMVIYVNLKRTPPPLKLIVARNLINVMKMRNVCTMIPLVHMFATVEMVIIFYEMLKFFL